MNTTRIRNLVLVGLCFIVVGMIFSAASNAGTARYPAADASQTSAVNFPDQFAWETFVAINQSAKNGTNDAVWETWALQRDIFADPNKKPVWPGVEHQPKVFSPSIKLQILLQQRLERRSKQLQLFRMDEKNNSSKPLVQFIAPNPLSEEVRMNRANFDFIVGNELWYLAGPSCGVQGRESIKLST